MWKRLWKKKNPAEFCSKEVKIQQMNKRRSYEIIMGISSKCNG